jgi:hypothetical protein
MTKRHHVLSSPKMSRSSSLNTPSKPILKKRSHSEIMLSSFASGKTHDNLLIRAAQAVEDERQREREERELREEQKRNPLTPTHILKSQIRRRSSTDLPSLRKAEDSLTPSPIITMGGKTDYFGNHWTTSTSSGGQTPSAAKHIHFNNRVEQCIAVDVKEEEEDSAVVDDDSTSSDEEGLFIMHSRHQKRKPSRRKSDPQSTIAKLPATSLRPADEPMREPPQLTFFGSLRGPPVVSEDPLQPTASGFYYEEGGGFSSSASPPEFPPQQAPYDLDDEMIDDFSFDHPFSSQLHTHERLPPSVATSSTVSSCHSSEAGSEEESTRRPSVAAIPIPSRRESALGVGGGMMGEDEDEEGMGIVGLAADALSTAKDFVGVLWNAGWGGRR